MERLRMQIISVFKGNGAVLKIWHISRCCHFYKYVYVSSKLEKLLDSSYHIFRTLIKQLFLMATAS